MLGKLATAIRRRAAAALRDLADSIAQEGPLTALYLRHQADQIEPPAAPARVHHITLADPFDLETPASRAARFRRPRGQA
jgi:hypothetical protein